MSYLRYYSRAFAAIYLIGMSLWATSRIGIEPSCAPLTWSGAWSAVSLLLISSIVGFAAGRESKEQP